ncbi:hypothetical protein E2L08_05925 [Palleronia sediminis]|uniref:S-methyl-5-thioribose-1-phosphate isomerase n=1 Tax=Palleronia sediminis TaxID=2547833 RepID=A0A4R6AF81_9RHOB|nr:hypothetical protein [Palleronia sediminis]TDL81644.1 hypothetical protein E2L08_05925 [Palleronia sediminis]
MPERRFEYRDILRQADLPDPDAETMHGLRDIVDEGVLGASNHVALALPLVARKARADRPTALTEAMELARFIARTRGVGAPIVANALNWQTEGIEDLSPAEAIERLQERAEAWDTAAATRRRELIERGVAALSACRNPLIYDYSSTVADLVRALASGGGLSRIVIPESRAIDGGRRYMSALADLGVPILFLPDAALEYAMSQSDAVLLGAESVTRDGGISNTIGSTLAARAAQAHNVAVYGAADLFKVGKRMAAELPAPDARTYDFLLKEGEVASTSAPELEIVPPDLVTAILTELGPVAPADLSAALAHRSA